MTIFGNFDYVTFKKEKYDLAYHIENFMRNIMKKKKNCQKMDF
jgi:hypothetical protein